MQFEHESFEVTPIKSRKPGRPKKNAKVWMLYEAMTFLF